MKGLRGGIDGNYVLLDVPLHITVVGWLPATQLVPWHVPVVDKHALPPVEA